ncbi:MAG: TolC family protein [Candidatus Cloacimonetes bacterium]|nr:TolC family protein [Candidatus Cloacimonadota bacterium]
MKFNSGNISFSELLQFRSMSAQQEVSVLKANNSLQIALSDLAGFLIKDNDFNLMNISFTQYDEAVQELGSWQISDLNNIETSLIEYARVNNPAYQTGVIEVDINESEVKSAKGSFLPSISMNLSKNWNYQNWSDSPEGSLSLGISASVPVFSIYDNYLNYTKARNSYRKTELSHEQSGIDLKLKIKSGILNLVASILEIEATETAREYSALSYEAAQEQFKNNMITANELLNTQISLRTAENGLNTSKYSFLNNKSELQKSLGILEESELWKLLLN